MKPQLIRRIWSTIDTSANPSLLRLSDSELAQCLTERLEPSADLSPEDYSEIHRYLCERAPLIRDVVQS